MLHKLSLLQTPRAAVQRFVLCRRPPLCRYDVVLTENAERSFRPIPCAGRRGAAAADG